MILQPGLAARPGRGGRGGGGRAAEPGQCDARARVPGLQPQHGPGERRQSIWRRKARAGAVRRETGGDAADPEAADDEQAEAVRQQEEPGEMGTRETRNLVRIVLVCLQLDMFPPYTVPDQGPSPR